MALTLNGTTGIQNVLGSAAAPAESNTTSSNTGMYFPTSTTLGFSTAGTNAVTIDASQNVGVGTSSPLVPLAVKTDTDFVVGIGKTSAGTGARVVGLNLAQNAYKDFVVDGATVQFATSGTERARIDSSGNLLVGTTSGGIKIQPNGTQGYVGTITPTTRGIEFDNNSSARVYYFTNTSGAAYASLQASAFNVSSDYRLKENILPITNALSQVAKLKPSQFNYRADIETKMPCGESTVTGFIAHELAEIIPYAVSGEKDAVDDNGKPMYQGIDTGFLIATLTAAIQEQQALITQLTDRIAALEAK